jgi:hypothetical protein
VTEESESIAAADAISAEDLPTDRVRLSSRPTEISTSEVAARYKNLTTEKFVHINVETNL